jgi:hypothetical protein
LFAEILQASGVLQARVRFDPLAIGSFEHECLVFAFRETKAPFVKQPVMVAAQLHEVIQAGLPTVGPVPDVVGIHITVLAAPGKATPAVAGIQRTLHRRRYGPGLPSDVEGMAVFILD